MRRSRESTRGAILLIAAFVSLCTACGSPQRSSPEELLLPAQPMRLRVPEQADRLDGLVLPPDTSLDVAFEIVWHAVVESGAMPFDPTAVLEGEDLGGFARYLTWQQTLLEGDVHHIAFVVVDPWTPARTEQFTRFFAAMPARTPVRSGAPQFHVISAHPVPFAVDYLFGGHWWGALESELYVTLADAPLDPETAPATAQLVRAVLRNWGIVVPAGPSALATLDNIRLLLPAPPPDSPWRPRGTLVALGLLLGEALRDADSQLTWVAAAPSLATTFALSVDHDPDQILRPIDFALEAWGTPNLTPFADYAALVEQRVAETRATAP